MSVSAVGNVTQPDQPVRKPPVITPSPTQTPFSQQLDTQTAQSGQAHGHGHHHHHANASQSVTSSAKTAASASGTGATGSVASAVQNLLG